MLKKSVIAALSLISISSAYAGDIDLSCMVQVAVASPPVMPKENVAFNVANEYGFSKSVTLNGTSGPQYIENVPCSEHPLFITATPYETPSNTLLNQSGVGIAKLKAGPIFLGFPGNSVSVVFPYDFTTNE
ncbi:hypothetical protein [Legionella saoudiensis]|uniref:hypothetical protein n=1 Tax=Legionella saoudiensis TaxID=1750561 RepID=UPI000730E8DC|nr:hypothetical protein [Legionella saoudiensis]